MAPSRRNALANVERYIVQLKVMGAGTFNYPLGEARSRDKTADRKARTLPALYRGKLANIDLLFYNMVQGEVGPCQERLRSLWDLLQVVVGYWGKVFTDLDRIVRAIAEARMLYRAQETGRPITDHRVSQVLGQHRRSLSAAFFRPQMACLTSRMGHLGVGSREAVARKGAGDGGGAEDTEGGRGSLLRSREHGGGGSEGTKLALWICFYYNKLILWIIRFVYVFTMD